MKFFSLYDPKKNIDFVRLGPTAVKVGFGLMLAILISAAVFGVSWGIDFAGGTELQVRFGKQVDRGDIVKVLEKAGYQKNQVQGYGPAEQNEWLVRVERMTTMTAEDVQKVKEILTREFSAELAGAGADAVKVEFNEGEGDRIYVTLPAPKAQAAAAPASPEPGADGATPEAAAPTDAAGGAAEVAAVKALDDQQQRLARALDEQSGLRLRRTIPPGQTQETTDDAVIRDEPYQGKVKYLVQFQGVSDKLSKELSAAFGQVEVRRVDFVDARVAEQLKTDGVFALVVALLLILVYVAVRFDVFFAPGAIVALIHDPILALGLFVFARMEFDLPSVAALLTVIGYSINSTIVIYDRVRETVPAGGKTPLSHDELRGYINKAINDTMNRTINTTVTTLFTSLAVFAFTSGAVKTFAAVLSVGFVVGAFSSVLIAPTVYLFFRKNFYNPESAQASEGPSREERARGVV